MSDPQHHSDLQGHTASADAVGHVLGVTRETVSRYAKNMDMPRKARGKYDLCECVQWALERQAKQAGDDENPAIVQARIDLMREQETGHKIKNATALGELIPAAIVQTQFMAMATATASQLDGLPARMAAELASIDNPTEIQRVLADECAAIRDSAAAAFAASAGAVESEPDTAQPTEKKRGAVGRRRKGATTKQPRTRKVAN